MKARYILTALALAMAAAGASADEACYSLSAPEVTVTAGTPTEIAVDLANHGGVRGLQCDVVLPDGFEVDLDGIALSERAAGHTISASRVDDGRIIITVVSLASAEIGGTSGRLFTIPVTPICDPGVYQARFSYVVLSTTSDNRYQAPDFAATVNVLAPASYRVEVPNIAVQENNPFEISVAMTSEREVQGLQFDLIIPDGCLPLLDDIRLDSRAETHDVRATRLDDGRILVTITSMDGKLIHGNSGNVVSIPVIASVDPGCYKIELQYVVLSVPEVGRVQCPDVTAQLTVGSTGINLDGSALRVYSSNMNIVVEGAEPDDVVTVADSSGRVVYSGTSRLVPVAVHDVYLVTVASVTTKLAI